MALLGKKKRQPQWTMVALVADFRSTLAVQVDGQTYALLKSGEQVFCSQGSCSHEFSPLADGLVMDGEIFCEKHGSRFRLSDGAVLSPPACSNIAMYPVEIRGTEVWIFV